MDQRSSPVTQAMPRAPELAHAQPTGTYVKDALYLACRAAQRGDQPGACKNLSTARQQLDLVGDQGEHAYWADQLDKATQFVNALGDSADQLQTQAALTDADYTRGQSLTADEQAKLIDDNADTQRALDSPEPSLAYNRIPNPAGITGSLVATLNPAGAKDAGIKAKPVAIGGLSFGTWVLLGVAVLVAAASGYAAVISRGVSA